jgi:hypothetical protein
MTIEFLNVQGNVVQALPGMTFAGKYVTVSVMIGMLRHYVQTEGFIGFRFRIGSARTSAVIVL